MVTVGIGVQMFTTVCSSERVNINDVGAIALKALKHLLPYLMGSMPGLGTWSGYVLIMVQ